ncbi:MAG: CDP-diacylglycerol--glycerol-3-phosphate 3-phosphatidyltransferase [candidate division KSB1 bacterium]|nr:CDP-diacylglycerol--glycerol-3-phosphate 3-phosphatidyltransferase [candidate division KSB1 bacterium]
MVHHIPNILTIFRIAITPVFIYAFYLPGLVWKIVALLIFIFSTLTDKFDGFLARRYGWESDLGKYLDPLADKILITAAFICLIGYKYIDIWMVAVIVIRDVFVTWLRSFGIKKGKPVHTMEIARWKTAVQTIAIYIALVFMIAKVMLKHGAFIWASLIRALEEMRFVWIVMLITTLFTLVTGVLYFLENRHLFRVEN